MGVDIDGCENWWMWILMVPELVDVDIDGC